MRRKIRLITLTAAVTLLLVFSAAGSAYYIQGRTVEKLISGIECVRLNSRYAVFQSLNGKDAVFVSGVVTYLQASKRKTERHAWAMVDGVVSDQAISSENFPVYAPNFTFPVSLSFTDTISGLRMPGHNWLGVVNLFLDYFAVRGALDRQLALREHP